jgi:hypothetical protein
MLDYEDKTKRKFFENHLNKYLKFKKEEEEKKQEEFKKLCKQLGIDYNKTLPYKELGMCLC